MTTWLYLSIPLAITKPSQNEYHLNFASSMQKLAVRVLQRIAILGEASRIWHHNCRKFCCDLANQNFGIWEEAEAIRNWHVLSSCCHVLCNTSSTITPFHLPSGRYLIHPITQLAFGLANWIQRLRSWWQECELDTAIFGWDLAPRG